MVHNERTSTQKVLQYQWYDIQTDEPERQIKRNDRRRPVKTPGNRRNARKTPTRNWRQLRSDRLQRKRMGRETAIS